MPVLAEQTIKGTGLIKDSQVLIAIFSSSGIGKLRVTSPGSSGTDPISHAVGRQNIIVPANIAFLSSSTHQFIFLVDAQSAIALFSGGYTTLISTKVAAPPFFGLRRLIR